MKSELQKMMAGEAYAASDVELVNARFRAKTLCQQYNALLPEQKNEKREIIIKLLAKFGENIIIEPNFFCDYGFNIEVGENFYANHNLVILDCAKVQFGKNVFIGPNCGFYTAIHPLDKKERAKEIEYAKPIKIGNDVWIGGGVTVLPGVEIGDGVVIGAGSVVTKNIPPNSVAYGNPCKVRKGL